MSCFICERIEMIKNETNLYFVKELETGYVVIGDFQYFYGRTIFLCKEHVTELHYLESTFKQKHLEEMALVQEAVAKAFKAEKMNIEMLGNADSHVHWHLFPRQQGDLQPYASKGPVWWVPLEVMEGEAARPTNEKLAEMVETLRKTLDEVLESE
ncbi:HIT family protein [Lactococcus allomyrinae]|uniref:HIT family protein n=1 Tax=Lactococcus allomyrinae TaxID=2419773 RepID=A0A387BH29_9LACT|nr:HIT family protein [Lactococcus allomyrinae]AYG01472.1 HIT family protein [Lactococcus allomyrinae]